MSAESSAPCRHQGAPPPEVVDKVARVITGLAADDQFLLRQGLSSREFQEALPAAIEAMRGRMSASNSSRRKFLVALFEYMVTAGTITSVTEPDYGEDTVYRLEVPNVGPVAVIQKGCPDGAHSSVRWSRPAWAVEAYLWWICSSMAAHPGIHVSKGVNRLRQRFFSNAPDVLDGVVFHNDLCGTSVRPCPKHAKSAEIDGQSVPPPCLYIMPERDLSRDSWNWSGGRTASFPAVLFSAFGIANSDAAAYTGYIGFERRPSGSLRTTIASRYGPGRTTIYRN